MQTSGGRRRLRIQDIAHSMGLSKATVSRALNGKQDVDSQTRKRVLEVAGRLGYVPSASARALSNGHSNTLGLLVPSLTWPWMLEVIRGVADAIEQSHYSLMLYTTAGGPESARAFISQAFPASFIDGLALVVPPGMQDYIHDLARQGLPVVVIDDRGDHPEFPAVATTNLDGGLAATRHLISLGRRRIAMINGPVEYGCNRDRLEGYRRALAEAGLAFDRHLVAQGDFSEASGVAAMQSLLQAGRTIDAVFVANDQMAFGAMSALRHAGRTVPDNVAVVGFDDLPAAALMQPPLTTVRQPLYEMGRTAAVMLMAAVRGEPVEKLVELPTELIVRSSTAGSAAPVPESAGG